MEALSVCPMGFFKKTSNKILKKKKLLNGTEGNRILSTTP